MTKPLSLTNRRSFLRVSAAFPFALRALAAPPAAQPGWLLLGTDKGEGIYRARWNGATGEIGTPELAIATPRPTFLAMHPRLPLLYAANGGNGAQAGVSCFRVNRATAELQLVSQRETHGDSPCYVSLDRTGQSLFAANYGGGSLTAFRLDAEGSLVQTVGVFRYNQPTHGPVADRQDAAHLHCATVAPTNDFVLVCDLGDDVILVFPIAPDRNSYVGGPQRIPARPGSGPRHAAFHPNGRWVYCLHEIDCTIDLYDWSVEGVHASMTLREGSAVSTMMPLATQAGNTASELVISDDGKLLYAATRGENSLIVYAIDAVTGAIKPVQRLSCGGQVPRYLAFSPSRRWFLCTNQGSSTITVFAHNQQTGKLIPKAKKFPADSPMFVQWL